MSFTAALLIGHSCLAVALRLPQGGSGSTGRPNILVVLSDDVGWADHSFNCDNSSCAADTPERCCPSTPELDAMARSPHSVLFRRAYSEEFCAPSRAALLTGRSAARACVRARKSFGGKDDWAYEVDTVLPQNQFTAGNAAHAAGYRTFFMGKWHLGNFWGKRTSHPGLFGFDSWYATKVSTHSSTLNCGCFPANGVCALGGGLFGNISHCSNYWHAEPTAHLGVANMSERQLGDDTEFIVEHFLKWLDEGDPSRPWLAFLWLHTVHLPNAALPQWYHRAVFPAVNGDRHGLLAQMDHGLGRLRQALKDRRQYEDTLHWYLSDNGPTRKRHPHVATTTSTRGFSADGAAPHVLRQCKGSLFEGGLRVPSFVEWPAVIKSHVETSFPVAIYDVLPTLLEVFGVERPAPYSDWELDGISLRRWLTEGFPKERPKPVAWAGTRRQVALLDGELKLLQEPRQGMCPPTDGKHLFKGAKKAKHVVGWLLFNLSSDPEEAVNLKSRLPLAFNQMLSKLKAWVQGVKRSAREESSMPCSLR